MRRAQTRHNETGQSIVELALAMPVLLLLVLGVVDLGMGFKTYIALTNAAREGVRWVSIHPDQRAAAQGRVELEALAGTGLAAEAITITFTPDKAIYAPDDEVSVTVAHDYQLLFGAVTGIPKVPFNARATMVVLYEPPSPTP